MSGGERNLHYFSANLPLSKLLSWAFLDVAYNSGLFAHLLFTNHLLLLGLANAIQNVNIQFKSNLKGHCHNAFPELPWPSMPTEGGVLWIGLASHT